MEKKHQIRISEIKNLAKRIHEINSMNIKDIDFIDSYLKRVDINPQIIEDWKFTGLNIMDFIMTGFYKTGFDRGEEKIKVSSHKTIQQGADSGQLQQHVVMGRSELLLAFCTHLEKEGGSPFIDKQALVDDFLKASNSP